MKASQNIYSIHIRCKRYVQRYLMRHFGTPLQGHPHLVDIRKDSELAKFVKKAIEQPNVRFDKYYSQFENKKRNCEIEVRISADQFERYGWALSASDEVSLNLIIEKRCKTSLINFLSAQFLIGETLDSSIDEFYHESGFSDRTWPKSSIEKIWSRYKAKNDVLTLKDEFQRFFREKVMEIMSQKMDNITTPKNICIN